METKHKCETCGKEELFVLDLWKHKAQDHRDAYGKDFLLYVLTEQNYELAEKVKRLEVVSRDAVTGVDQVLKAINHAKLEGELGTAQELEGEATPRMGRHWDSSGRSGDQADVSLGLARGLEGSADKSMVAC